MRKRFLLCWRLGLILLCVCADACVCQKVGQGAWEKQMCISMETSQQAAPRPGGHMVLWVFGDLGSQGGDLR